METSLFGSDEATTELFPATGDNLHGIYQNGVQYGAKGEFARVSWECVKVSQRLSITVA